jgi:hypothetical protein
MPYLRQTIDRSRRGGRPLGALHWLPGANNRSIIPYVESDIIKAVAGELDETRRESRC